MMYTIVFRKKNIELQISTTDKEFVARKLDEIITQASGHCVNNMNEKSGSDIDRLEEQQEHLEYTQPENQTQEVFEDNVPSVEPAIFHHITEDERKSIIQQADDIVPQSLDIGNVKPLTINTIQNPEPVQEATVDFDNILNNEMNNQNAEVPVLKNEKFIEYVESKSAIEKFDFLIITAQYLAQYEGMNTFNLKHINAKLMQNFTIIVDHSVLQSAISREYITRIQEGSDIASSEYMLTEKGLRSY